MRSKIAIARRLFYSSRRIQRTPSLRRPMNYQPIQRILVPLDLSEYSKAATQGTWEEAFE